MASHNNEFVSHYHKCTIKITLTKANLQTGYIAFSKEEVEKHILKHQSGRKMIEGAITNDKRLRIEDVNTCKDYEVDFRCYLGYVCIIHGLFRSNFIERRSLRVGDEIGFYWDDATDKLCFIVLMRNFL